MNKLIKAILILGVYLLAVLQCCILGWVCGCVITSAVYTVWSAVSVLPQTVADNFWMVPLLSGAPFALVLFILVTVQRRK